METFAVDKSFYDIGASDLKELWDSDLDPAITEVFRGDPDIQEWTAFLDVKPQIILHDRLMTDAALGTMPIKSEHSYSLASDGDSMPDSPISLENKVDDMEDECYPCIPLNSATGQTRLGAESADIMIKDEPMSDLDDSDDSDCSMSCDSPPPLIHTDIKHSSQQSLLKQPTILLTTSRGNSFGQQNSRAVMPKLNIKCEPNASGFSLPPTPPSSSSSDSEGNVSPDHNPDSPDRQGRTSSGGTRIFLSSSSAANRQPIQTSLISNQPVRRLATRVSNLSKKGSTGMLILTEEEKRTLLAEGYPIPTRLPLTKAEEKSLKKIRRKIKNKISAQESRRKKKEYMDALERKVEVLTCENTDYKKKIDTLEESNTTLMSQLQKLQALVARGGQTSNKTSAAATSSMVSGSQHLTRSSVNK